MAVSSTGLLWDDFSRPGTSLDGLRRNRCSSRGRSSLRTGADRLHDVLSARRVGGKCVCEQAGLPAYIVYLGRLLDHSIVWKVMSFPVYRTRTRLDKT